MFKPLHVFATALALPVLIACTDKGGYVVDVRPLTADSSASAAAHVGEDLVLPLEVDLQVAETFVRIGFGLNEKQRFQSTEFLTPRLRTVQAAPLIRLVKNYNEFDGERVAAAVEQLRGRVSATEFGREGSPVLYLELPYWTHQREESRERPGTKISDRETAMFVDELRKTFVGNLKADEFQLDGRRLRIWWD